MGLNTIPVYQYKPNTFIVTIYTFHKWIYNLFCIVISSVVLDDSQGKCVFYVERSELLIFHRYHLPYSLPIFFCEDRMHKNTCWWVFCFCRSSNSSHSFQWIFLKFNDKFGIEACYRDVVSLSSKANPFKKFLLIIDLFVLLENIMWLFMPCLLYTSRCV